MQRFRIKASLYGKNLEEYITPLKDGALKFANLNKAEITIKPTGEIIFDVLTYADTETQANDLIYKEISELSELVFKKAVYYKLEIFNIKKG